MTLNLMVKLLVCCNLIVLFSQLAHAQVECTSPNKSNDIIKCLQQKHPNVVSESLINEATTSLVKQETTWKNPNLSLENISGKKVNESINEIELRISQSFEFSGIRNAKKNLAIAQGETYKAENLAQVETITLYGIKSLFRLRQINEEIDKMNEAISKFKIIKRQYLTRVKLAPDQEVTLAIIELAISDFEIQLNQLNAEKSETLNLLTANTGLSFEQIQDNLPKKIFDWPNINNSLNEIQSSSIKMNHASVEENKALLDLANSNNFTEFSIDLIAQSSREGDEKFKTYGIGVSFPLPMFQRNQGDRKLTAIDYHKAQSTLKAETIRAIKMLETYKSLYEASTSNLKNTPSERSIESKHQKAEALFNQGLISGSLIIETHKQIIEYIKNRNFEEMRAIESLWQVYILTGTFMNQSI